MLPVNRAMPFWVDLKDGAEIAPCTTAWAQKNGWIWQIPTQDRYGMGYVYSDAHTTPDQAKAEVEALLGAPTECSGAVGISSCNWGDEKTFISVQYAGDKVLMFSGQGLK